MTGPVPHDMTPDQLTDEPGLAARLCSVDDCARKHLARNLCNLHYKRMTATGSTDPAPRLSHEQRFIEKIAAESAESCWQWTAAIHPNGYGQFSIVGRRQGWAHRASYKLFVGAIPTGWTVDHECHNLDETCTGPCHHRACVNPAHLVARPGVENRRRAMRDHCQRGHPFDVANTYLRRGVRFCKACAARRSRQTRARKAARR